MKKLLLIVTILAMSISSICFASDGSDLDAEQKIATAVLNVYYKNGNAEEVKQFCSADFSKNFLATTGLEKIRKESKDAFGSLKGAFFVAYAKFNIADKDKKVTPVNQVSFRGVGDKDTPIDYVFLFDVSGKKPILASMRVNVLKAQPKANSEETK